MEVEKMLQKKIYMSDIYLVVAQFDMAINSNFIDGEV